MDIDRYIVTNTPVWNRLAELAGRGRRGVGGLSASELEELVRLYQRVAGHLSYAQTYYRDPALVAKLSGLVARAGALVYGTRARTLRAFGRFLAQTFPAAVWYARRFVLVSALLLAAPAAAVAVWIGNSTAALEAVGPAAVRRAIVEEDFEAYYASEEASQFASQVFTNNVRVAFLAFAAGIFLCLGTAYLLLFNGGNIGVMLGLFVAVGQQPKFWGLILPHGLLELSAVCVAGAAGLRLGWTLIDPGDRPRGEALAEEGRRAVVIVLGLVVAFAVAGLIEGFVTGQPWPTWLRVGIGVVAELGFLAWVVVGGRAAAAQGLTGALGEQDPGGWVSDRRLPGPAVTGGRSP